MDKRLRFDSEQFKILKSNLKEALWEDLSQLETSNPRWSIMSSKSTSGTKRLT